MSTDAGTSLATTISGRRLSGSSSPQAPTSIGGASAPASQQQAANDSVVIDLTSTSSQAASGSGNGGPPSLKRKLTDLMDDLVAQAKASKADDGRRIQTSVTKADDDDDDRIGNKLAVELTCAICSDIFANPVTCLDCLHIFCGNCIVSWTEAGNATCPSCRKKIRSTRDSFNLKPIIELLFQSNPELRPDDYDQSMAGPYKPGQKINIPDYYDDDSAGEEDEEEEDDEEPPNAWEPCLCCAPGGYAGYHCPNPLQLNADGSPVRTWGTVNSGHRLCSSCDKPVPYDENNDTLKKTRCIGCSKIFCGNLFGSCSAQPNDIIVVKIGDNSLFNANHRGPYHSLGTHINQVEENLFNDWLNSDGNNITMEEIGTRVRRWIFEKNNNQITLGGSIATGDDYACKVCLNGALVANVREYLIDKREELGFTDDRSKCWYGWECRTQRHNQDHCQRLAHLCAVIPTNERRNTARRNPPAVTTGSARNMPQPPARRANATPSPDSSPVGSPRRLSGADDGDGRQSPH